MSDPKSSGSLGNEHRTVSTEPLPPSVLQHEEDFMSRRQQFLSDYERYNPVQNMQMLANHVFDLSDNVRELHTDFTASRRILSDNQRDFSNSLKDIGSHLDSVSHDVLEVVGDLGRVKSYLGEVDSRLGGVEGRLGGVETDLNNLRSEMQLGFQELHQDVRETKIGIQELKNMLTAMIRVS